MAYLALYRKYRPKTLNELVRQEHIVKTLVNQIESGKIGHAYLFTGPRGTGKTSTAKIFAKAINCEVNHNGSPCNNCKTCKALNDPSNLDILEIDAASNNKVDEIRELREKVQYPPINAKYKVYIIDEVHMLTDQAFNALLKTLEEPPKHAVFILATTEVQKLPATILSRCMRFDFKLLPLEDIANHIKRIFNEEGKQYEEEAVCEIARAGAGSVRDALSIAEICLSYSANKLTYSDVLEILGGTDFDKMLSLSQNILSQNTGKSLEELNLLILSGKSVGVLNRDLITFLRNLVVAKNCANVKSILSMPEEYLIKLKEISKDIDLNKLLRSIEIFSEINNELKFSTNSRIVLETGVIKASMPEKDYNIDALLSRITALENKLKNIDDNLLNNKNKDSKIFEKEVTKIEQPKNMPILNNDILIEKLNNAEYNFDNNKNIAYNENVVNFEDIADIKNDCNLANTDNKIENKQVKKIDSNKLWGQLIISLRKNKQHILYTICQDLSCSFDGETVIISAEKELHYNALNAEQNYKTIKTILEGFGYTKFEIKYNGDTSDNFSLDIEKIKQDFKDTNIIIK